MWVIERGLQTSQSWATGGRAGRITSNEDSKHGSSSLGMFTLKRLHVLKCSEFTCKQAMKLIVSDALGHLNPKKKTKTGTPHVLELQFSINQHAEGP